MININEKGKQACCGCTACASVCPQKCITMVEDSEGFKYPQTDLDICTNCHLCESVCPCIGRNDNKDFLPIEACIVRNTDPDIVLNSSSGGAVSAFGEKIIEDGGIVFGCALDENFEVKHTSCESKEGLSAFRGSKYVQSELSDTFIRVKNELQSGRKVMFTGTPCQVHGLIKYLRKPYDNLFTVDFVCHGVPSPMVWRKYKEMMTDKYESDIVSINFREKTYGYHSGNLAMRFANGKKSIENTKTDYFLKCFYDDISTRPSCYECKFKTVKRLSDLTVFECWDITRYDPEVLYDDKGLTSVFVQSEKGRRMLDSVKDKLVSCPADIELLLKNDGYVAIKSFPAHPKRSEYFEMLNSGVPLDKTVAKLSPIKLSRKIFSRLKGTLYKTGLLKLIKKLA